MFLTLSHNGGKDKAVGKNMLSGEAPLSVWFCLASEKGSIVKRKNLLPMGKNLSF